MTRPTVTTAEARKLGLPVPKGRQKYGNKITAVDGVKFRSRKEAKRWGELLLLEMADKIRDLERQVTFPLVVEGVLICKYVCDFTYVENGERVVEDVKSPVTRRNLLYLVKRRLMLACHGVVIRET